MYISCFNVEQLNNFMNSEETKDDIMFTYCGDNDSSREARLNSVLGFITCKFECSSIDLKRVSGLLALHDHKGCLRCVWNDYESMTAGTNHLCDAWRANHENSVDIYILEDGMPKFVFTREL